MSPAPLPERYEDLGVVGEGATCEVRRVHDTLLATDLAMKVLRASLVERVAVTRKFHGEARLTARLRHPGIPPVHDLGTLEDGRLWFTMALVQGSTLRQAIAAHHHAARRGEAPEHTLRDLVRMLLQVAEAVGYAHAEGVVHRDLKPSNIMLGEHGEVLLMDWGIARHGPGADEITEEAFAQAPSRHRTMIGKAIGTPSYMPPEQARGDRDAIGPASDVYALGACLYKLLSGRSPYRGSPREVVMRVRGGPPRPVSEAAWRALDAELVELCEWAMQRRSDRRPASGRAFAQSLQAWLDHQQRRERADVVLAKAETILDRVRTLEAEEHDLERRLGVARTRVQRWEPVEQRRPLWEMEDRVAEAALQRRRLQVACVQQLRGALAGGAVIVQAQRKLARMYRDRAEEAEARGDRLSFETAVAQLRSVDDGTHADWIAGKAWISLTTDPPGAVVRAFELEPGTWDMRRSSTPTAVLGETPLGRVELGKGSWVLTLTAPGRVTTTLPVFLDRLEHQRLRRPGDEGLTPVLLPPDGAVGEGECYVPAGWCRVGGDGLDAFPPRRVWVDGFVIQRTPVSLGAWVDFLQDRLRLGQSVAGLVPTTCRVEGHVVEPSESLELPARGVSWRAARTYAAWRAELSGLPWRLPHELEWAKAARGADGRPYPWGHRGDPVLAAVLGSGATYRTPLDDFPHDVSVYGVRGLVGHVHEHTATPYTEVPPAADRPIDLSPRSESSSWRIVRGGNVLTPSPLERLSSRWATHEDVGKAFGFRLVRSL